jgi:cysteine desulfurase
MEIYLDYNASAPVDPRVVDVVSRHLAFGIGNASSSHRYGYRQAAAVETAREQVADLLSARPRGVVFTSGATEANNLALRGIAERAPSSRCRILVSSVEHASVLGVARLLSDAGLAKVEFIPVTTGGGVDLDALARMMSDEVLLVSVMAANSETGVCNPLVAIGEIVHESGALFHCDATQAAGRISVGLTDGMDLLSISGHKLCGPQGVGALVGSRTVIDGLHPLIVGGKHERGLRSGSLNVPGIVGLGVAAHILRGEREAESARVRQLRDRLVFALTRRLPEVHEIGDPIARLPNTASLRFAKADAEAVLNQIDPVAASTGSACSSGAIEPSHVLLAMGLTRDEACEVVRFSLGRFTTPAEIEEAVDRIVTGVEYVRSASEGEVRAAH